jgi:choline dehydrogenase-like flavoprotein
MGEDCVCVVGSGPTGVIAALTLIEAGIPVVMLESGSTFPRRWHIRVNNIDIFRPAPPTLREPVPDVDFVCLEDSGARWIKANCLGGLSNYWSGIALRFSKGDFLDGEQRHFKYQWPISYEDLEPYYERVEKLIYVRGGKESFDTLPACSVTYERQVGREWKRFQEVAGDAGRVLVPTPDVQGPSTIMSDRGTPQNLALRLLPRLIESPRFRLVTNAHVTRVLLDPHKPLAKGVEYVDKGTGTFHKVDAKAVILAAGPLASTQILLNSQSASFPQGLGNSQGVLGRYLHDHPLEYTNIEGNFRFSRLDDRRRGGLYLTRAHYSKSVPLEASAVLIYGGTFLSMMPFLLLLRHSYYLKVFQRMMASRRTSKGRAISPLNGSMIYVCTFGTQVPCEGNYVRLDPDKRDPYGVPLLQINTRYSGAELENMKRAVMLVPEILEATGTEFYRVSSDLQSRGTSVHYGGTVRMHNSPQYGVSDRWNRLHDVKNVLVVDASSFTTCVEKNPSLTAMSLSMRAAEKLSQDRS